MDMKRRKRKRSSKSARPAKIPVDAKTAAGDATALAGADYVIDLGDEFLATVEEEKPASDSVTLAEADDHTHSGDEFMAAVEEEKAAGPSAAPAGADRRTHPRYEFTAAGAWGWCLPPLSRGTVAPLQRGLPNPARPPGSRQT